MLLVSTFGAFIFFAALYVMLQSFVPQLNHIWKWTVSAGMGFFGVWITVLVLYYFYTGSGFDWNFAGDNAVDVIPTVVNVLGIHRIGACLLLCSVTGISLGWMMLDSTRRLDHSKKTAWKSSMALVVVLCTAPLMTGWKRPATPPITPNETYETSSNENVFILQLESTNGLAMSGMHTGEGVSAYKKYMPVMARVAEEGTLVPLFWGNTIQTSRAQEATLCGVTANIGKSLSNAEKGDELTCLPKLLQESGYRTFFYSGYENKEFGKKEEFTKEIGFNERHFADMMEPGDRKYTWGYDDCTFYNRVFDDLEKKYTTNTRKNLFVLTEVSSHHVPFDLKAEYASIAPFSNPKSEVEKYLNSIAYQDACVGQFVQRWKAFSPNSHLMIVGDHSFPMGMHGSWSNGRGSAAENFLVPFAYLPPHNGQYSKNTVIEGPHFSETDIVPTVFDLLNASAEGNSFAWALRGKNQEDYDDCHILTQPYGEPTIVVVKGQEKYDYIVRTGEVIFTDLSNDLAEQHPSIIESHMTMQTFKEIYFCARYQKS